MGQWKPVDANTILQHEPDGSAIKTTFTADRQAAVYHYLTGSKAGYAGAVVSIKSAN